MYWETHINVLPKETVSAYRLGMSKTSHLLTWFHPVLLSACYSEAKASVPSISNKLGERLVRDFLLRDSSPTEGVTETQFDKGSPGGEDDARTSNTLIAHSIEKAHGTNLRHGIDRCIDRMCVIVTVLCNQPEAFTSDLGDD